MFNNEDGFFVKIFFKKKRTQHNTKSIVYLI